MITWLAFALAFAALAGCSKPSPTPAPSAPVSSASSAVSSDASSNANSVDAASSGVSSPASASSQQDDSQKVLLQAMKKAAQDGKILQGEFAVKSGLIDDVQAKWGKADKSEYIPAAKGVYDTYSKHSTVFGYNKGSQLFEVRSTDASLKAISLSQAKAVLGKPDYDSKSGNEEIIGYVITKEFKILLVFPQPKAGEDPKLDHYSVFYPAGTVNTMADDPGREW